ncbi:DUF3787 domain-containing protein [Clostridium sp. WILCCON 0269]|uniref:DUF3787 domain-containing protein n=1 Tax=Candidatus Clostridium eludens TaxID=3381663 RepID=A0ABW8SGT3_9CLOT
MLKNQNKEKVNKDILENHQTAAWANITKTKPISKVTIPNETEVKNAKEWVDSNEK